MPGINLKHTLATVAVAAGLLTAAGPASAGSHQSSLIGYNGHAGFGASAHQHAAAVTDGTSNTIMFAARAAAPGSFSIDVGTSENIASDGLGAY